MSSERLISEEDYATIEAAVMETSRGRWFLAEYANRNRNTDTRTVLEAIARLERAVASGPQASETDRLRFDLVDMAGAIARARAEVASIRPDGEGGRIGEATNVLDAIVKATEQATGDILAAAEHLQEVAWTLRETGVEGAACDIIDQRATDIYTACSFQDITGQRTQKVIQVLRYLEDRLAAMIAIWGTDAIPAAAPAGSNRDDALLNGPALPGRGLVQSDVDAMMRVPALLPPLPLEVEPVPPLQAQPTPKALGKRVEPKFELCPSVAGVEQAREPLLGVALAERPGQVREEAAHPPKGGQQARSGAPRGGGITLEDVKAEIAKAEMAQADLAGAGPVQAGAGRRDVSKAGPSAALESPFTPVNRPRPRSEGGAGQKAPATPAHPSPGARRVTLAEIEALSFEEKAALFS